MRAYVIGKRKYKELGEKKKEAIIEHELGMWHGLSPD